MPAGAKPGERRGGRAKGTPNKETRGILEIAAAMKTPPAVVLSMIADGDMICGACRGSGKTKYQPRRGQMRLAERTCESCYGSGKERITTDQRLRASEIMAKYMYPQRKSIEGNPDAPPIQHSITVRLVKADAARQPD